MLVCDECKKSSDVTPLALRGIIYTGLQEHIVVSVLCQKCDQGEDKTEHEWEKAKIK